MIIQETTKMSEREKMAARNSNFCYLLNALYPVGSIYVSKDPTEPSELFGGSWKRIKERFIWAIGDNENPGDTGGEKTHTLNVDEMPSHAHSPSDFDVNGNWVPATDAMSRTRYNSDSAGTKYIPSGDSLSDWKWGKTSSVGGSQPHNNMPPWEGFYIWERIESDVPMGGSAGMLLADQTYNPESANAQSGIAVAQAIDTCSPAIVTASDTGKAISIPDSSESVLKGLTAYGESTQDGTPTPDSPVEIVSVENPTITIAGKNLLNLQDRADAKPEGDFAITKYDTGNVIYRGFAHSGYYQEIEEYKSDVTVDENTVTFTQKVNGYGIGYVVKCCPNTNYCFSGKISCNVFCAIFIDKDGNKISTDFNIKFTTPQNARYVILSFSNNGTTGTYTITNPQLEIGSAATSYEPYNGEQTVTVPYTFAEGDMLILNNGIVKVNISGEETDITATETGQALLALQTYYPTTSVISDIDLNITYRADTKNYIDKRIAALTALTLEG